MEPIPMLLWCPKCGERHVDVGEFATKVHHTHACQGCGMVWQPAVVATVGVQFLPGFKTEPGPSPSDTRTVRAFCGVSRRVRCAVCGWPLGSPGCLRGNCSQRPQPERSTWYDEARAVAENPLLAKEESRG